MSSSETREFSDEFVTQELDQVHPRDARIIILGRNPNTQSMALAPIDLARTARAIEATLASGTEA
jgi:hypothetical protein